MVLEQVSKEMQERPRFGAFPRVGKEGVLSQSQNILFEDQGKLLDGGKRGIGFPGPLQLRVRLLTDVHALSKSRL